MKLRYSLIATGVAALLCTGSALGPGRRTSIRFSACSHSKQSCSRDAPRRAPRA